MARETALKILYKVDIEGAYLNIALDRELRNSDLNSTDRAFVSELVHGVIRWKLTLDYIIEKHSTVKLKKISPWILNILRIGIYQLMHMDRVPASAACNESVKLAKRYGHSASSGFVNAVLRNIQRNSDRIVYPCRNEDEVKYLSVKYSYPEWMVRRWLKEFGPDFTESFMEAGNKTPEISICTNVLKISPQLLKKRLKEKGISVREGRYIEETMILESSTSISSLEEFQEGLFQVQDEASALVAKILAPVEGETVLDVCAAPGGKSIHAAQIMNNKGTVISRDIHEHKIRLVEEAAKRVGTDIVKAEVYDALTEDASLTDKADRVLVDAPCTGFGIIRRKPDIKWARTEEQAQEIIKLQKNMLSTCCRYVKPGGVLVYSTCTIEKEENQAIIEDFLKVHKNFSSLGFNDILPEGLKRETAAQGYIQLYPNIDGTDGFFVAKMRRQS